MSPNQENPSHQPSSSLSDSAFPVLAIAVLSIIGTAFLLVSYYLLKRFSSLRATRQQDEDPFIAFSPSMWMNRGLEDSIIREIPTFQFKRGRESEITSVYGCVVCLNEFQQHEMIRVLPNCGHAFHLECIDVWFQSNDNCPLCRSSISGTRRYPIDQIIAPSSSPQADSVSLISNDEDFVVIELGRENRDVLIPNRQQEMEVSRSPMEKKKKVLEYSKRIKRNHHVSIMGDECIDVREKGKEFSIQPLRRSFSLDSAADRQLYLTVQKIVQRNERSSESSNAQEINSDRVSRRSLFSFGSKNAVLPVEFKL